MACYLYRNNDNGPSKIDCECEIQVLGFEETVLKSEIGSNTFRKDGSWGFSDFWKKPLPLNDDVTMERILKLRCHIKLNAEKIPLPLSSIAKTEIYLDKFSFIWNVRELNSDCSEEKKFPCDDTSQIEITIQVPEDDVKISISKTEDTESVSVMFRISLLDVNGKKCDTKQALHFFESTQNDIWKFPNFLKKSKLNAEKEKYLSNDSFTLKCKIEISNGKDTESIEDKDIFVNGTDTKSVLEDYKRLYKDKIHTDVKLLVEGEIIQAHKGILAVRSPVFLAMFYTDMVENVTGSVNIPDLEAETVNALLEYIYVGSVDKLDFKMAMKLIVAADKYQVLSLKEECANLLNCFLSRENVCNVLVVADLIQQKDLKTAAITYIKKNSDTIFLSKEWINVVENNLTLATETVQNVSMLIAADRKKN